MCARRFMSVNVSLEIVYHPSLQNEVEISEFLTD